MKKNHLGQYLREKRIDANLTQLEVAQELDYTSAQFISNFERGLCPFPLKKLKKLTKLYDIDPSEIIDMLTKERKALLETTFYGRQRKNRKSL